MAVFVVTAILAFAWYLFAFHQKLSGGLVILGIALLVGIDSVPMIFRYYRAFLSGKSIKSSGAFGKRKIEIDK